MKVKTVWFSPLSRRGKLARNLLVAAALLAGIWGLAGCPAWTEAGALHRLERTLLLPPGVVRCREAGEALGEATVLVTGENYAYVADVYSHLLWREAGSAIEGSELDRGPVLLRWTEPEIGGSMEWGIWLCPNPPAEAARAELTISLDYELEDKRQGSGPERGSAVLQAQGWAEDSGLVRLEAAAVTDREAVLLQELFSGVGYEAADAGGGRESCAIIRADWQLEFFDGTGASLGLRSVVLPEDVS